MSAPCPVYSWCEVDHATHEYYRPDQHVLYMHASLGDFDETFTIEVTDGTPRMWGNLPQLSEFSVDPSEARNTFRDAAEVLTRAADAYEALLARLTPTLRRHVSVTETLAEVES